MECRNATLGGNAGIATSCFTGRIGDLIQGNGTVEKNPSVMGSKVQVDDVSIQKRGIYPVDSPCFITDVKL